MSWAISYRSSVEKDIARLPQPIRVAVLKKLTEMANDPFPPGCRKLKGSISRYRLRVAHEYRVVHSVFAEDRVIKIEFVGHRKDAYCWF